MDVYIDIAKSSVKFSSRSLCHVQMEEGIISTSSPSLTFRFRPSPRVDPGACPREDTDTCRRWICFGGYIDVYTRRYMDGYTSSPRWRLCEPARILGEFRDRTRLPGPPPGPLPGAPPGNLRGTAWDPPPLRHRCHVYLVSNPNPNGNAARNPNPNRD